MDHLDLETMVEEVVYVPKARNLGELEAKAAEPSWKPILTGVGLLYAVAILLGGSIGLSFLTGTEEGVTYGLLISGPILTLVGFGWAIVAVATMRKAEKSPLKFAARVLASGLVAAGIGAALYATVDFKSGPAGPGATRFPAKPGQAQPAPAAAPKQGPKSEIRRRRLDGFHRDFSQLYASGVGISSRQQPRSICCLPWREGEFARIPRAADKF